MSFLNRSLRSRIFLSMILLVIGASILIVVVTVFQYRENTQDYHRERLIRKETAIRENIDYVIKCLGCRPIDQYTSADAAKYRDWLVEKGLASSSVKRVFSSVKAIVNLAINELGVDSKNAFAGVYLASRGDAKKRKPLSNDSLKHL